MIKKILLCVTLLIGTAGFAETCPTISDLKSNNLHGWDALDLNGDGPVSSRVYANFKNNVDHFALAEWMSDAPEGSAHCYYENKTDHDFLEIYFAKKRLAATKSNAWYKVNASTRQCKASLNDCEFQKE